MHRRRRLIRTALVALAVLAVVGLASCTDSETKAQKTDRTARDASIRNVVADQPAHGMTFSPTRKTINGWIDTWNVRGQLAFTYITDGGKPQRYFVLDGPPVSMCAALTQTWTYEGTPDDGDDVRDQRVPARSIDGVYYSGGQCLQYYGFDASTGSYVEFSIGGTQNYFLSTQPLPGDIPAAGPTTVAETTCVPNAPAGQPDCKVRAPG